MIFKLHFYLLLFMSSLYANVTIDENTTKTPLLPHSTMYLDTSSKMSFDEVQKQTFELVNSEDIKLGYTDSTVWIRLEIHNKLAYRSNQYLFVNKPILDTIDCYQ